MMRLFFFFVVFEYYHLLKQLSCQGKRNSIRYLLADYLRKDTYILYSQILRSLFQKKMGLRDCCDHCSSDAFTECVVCEADICLDHAKDCRICGRFYFCEWCLMEDPEFPKDCRFVRCEDCDTKKRQEKQVNVEYEKDQNHE